MFEGAFSPPTYGDRYNFLDGAQDDIFEDSYASLPDPSPVARLPVLNGNSDSVLNLTSRLGLRSSSSWYANYC